MSNSSTHKKSPSSEGLSYPKMLKPTIRIERTTCCLRNSCSTTEPRRQMRGNVTIIRWERQPLWLRNLREFASGRQSHSKGVYHDYRQPLPGGESKHPLELLTPWLRWWGTSPPHVHEIFPTSVSVNGVDRKSLISYKQTLRSSSIGMGCCESDFLINYDETVTEIPTSQVH